MIKQKKGFLPRDFLIAGILFGIIISMLLFGVADISQNYNDNTLTSQSFQAHYSTLQNQLDQLDVANKAVQGGTNGEGLNLIGTFNVAFNSVFTFIILMWNGLTIYGGMALNMSGDFPFLNHTVLLKFLLGIVAVLTAYLIASWLSSVMRGKI